MDNYLVRRMTLDDLDAIEEIENSTFTIPWSRQSFQNELVNNHFAYYLILEVEGQVAGYGGMWVIGDEAHVTNIAIASEYRGKKWGEKLMIAMKLHAIRQGANAMTLEVRASNTVAQNLYKKLGFDKTGVRPRYYSDNGEDALIMWVNFDHDADKPMETKSS
ncbi:ribosomal protein S18-alanine N-acetyltransferase [Ammoniphilus sp. 3BR4]|uniref:ribosomal protein S18-alanine N-acetyltransferase n=1 Tax=Ammoniphilus sp. 3BR4 TaxID=3158265 RepID=UPI003467CD40